MIYLNCGYNYVTDHLVKFCILRVLLINFKNKLNFLTLKYRLQYNTNKLCIHGYYYIHKLNFSNAVIILLHTV